MYFLKLKVKKKREDWQHFPPYNLLPLPFSTALHINHRNVKEAHISPTGISKLFTKSLTDTGQSPENQDHGGWNSGRKLTQTLTELIKFTNNSPTSKLWYLISPASVQQGYKMQRGGETDKPTRVFQTRIMYIWASCLSMIKHRNLGTRQGKWCFNKVRDRLVSCILHSLATAVEIQREQGANWDSRYTGQWP